MPLQDTPPDSQKRSSLPRLGSIASFHVLKPFTRRRSNNGADNSIAASSTSTLPLTSTPANVASLPVSSSSSLTFNSSDDAPPAIPGPPLPAHHSSSRRSSYICLPDDPLGGIPRSRTFSNLPLPTRTHRNAPVAASNTYSRLPSVLFPSTRLPSPPMSMRKHSHTRLTSADANSLAVRNRVERSDTEPLLPANVERASNVDRPSAFKENISLSPVKRYPPLFLFGNKQMHGSSLPSQAHAIRHGWVPPGERCENLLPPDTLATSIRFKGPLTPRGPNTLLKEKQPYSSPIHRSTHDCVSTPGGLQPVQRWNSQPILTNITNRRPSRHGEIRERRLMSAVEPVPPTSSTPRVCLPAESPGLRKATLTHPNPSPLSAPASPTDSRLIYTAQPIPYWCGRFSVLNDSLRNAELRFHLQHLRNGFATSKSESDKLNTPEANIHRMRRAMEQLHDLCATQAARDSFVVFQVQFAAVNACAELGRPIVLKLPEKKVEESKWQEQDVNAGEVEACAQPAEAGVSEGRKATLMERLLGKHRRSLVA